MTLDFLNRKRKRRLPFSDPMEGILEEVEETELAKIRPEDVSKYYDVFAATEEQLKQIEPPPEPDLDELLGNVFPNLRGTSGISTIKQMAEQDTKGFLAEIKRRGRTPDTEAVLRQYNVEPEEIFGLEQKPPQPDIENLVKQIWPETNLETFRDFIQGFKGELPPTTSERQIEVMRNEGASQFIEAMRAGGWSKAKQDLLQAFGLDESDIQEVLGPEVAKFAESAPILNLEPEWRNIRTGEVITTSEKASRYPKGYEAELDDWTLTAETARNYGGVFKVFAESLTKVPKQLGAAILQAIQGQGGASVVNKDWADRWIKGAAADQEAFVSKVAAEYQKTRLPVNVVDVAELPQNIAFSLTSMGVGLAAGLPVGLAPVPGARVAAWALGTAASGAVAYNMTTYQIMQQYLEVKNEEMMAQLGRGLTAKEEEMLKKDFSNQAMQYGLWEAIPEAVSNLAFAKILTMPLGKMVGRNIASKIIGKLFSLYGEEFLTETITQKGQSDIEVEAGLREEKISWIEAFKEVAPQTFLLTTILGGAGQVSVSAVQKIKQSLKREAGDSAVFKAINENITENVFNELEAEAIAKLERIVPPTAKAIRGVKAELPGMPEEAKPSLEQSELASLRRYKADLEKELTTATGPKVKELEGFLRTTEFSIRDLQEKMGKAAPAEAEPVTPEVTERITRTTAQQDIQETAKILSEKLKEGGIAERDISDLLDVYNISETVSQTRTSLTFEQLRRLSDSSITEDHLRKLTRVILGKKFNVPAHEVDLVLEGGSRVNPRLDVQQATAKAIEIDNLIKGNLPTHKDIVESLNRRLLVSPKAVTPTAPEVPEAVSAKPEAPKPIVARPGVAEVAKAEVPPVKPPPTAVIPPKPPKPPVEQVAERISFDPDKQSLKEKFQSGKNKAIVHWIDKLYPIDKFVSQAKKTGVDLGIEENPYLLARLLEGVTSKATNFIENGTFTRKFWKTEKGKIVPDYKGKGLSQILESVKKPQAWRDFSIYLTAVHAQELAKLDIKTGIEADVATSAIKELESRYPNFSKLAGKLQNYQKQLLDYVQESGLISEDLRAKLDAKYYAYVPFYRVMDELQAGGYMGKKMADIASPIKRIKGSEREIINPLESIIKNTYAMINAADRNQVGVAMARIAHDVPDVAPMFQHIKTPIAKVATVTAKELGIEITGLSEAETEEVFNIFRPSMFKAENVATVMIEGKKRFFEVDPDLNKALHALDQGSMGILWKVLSAPAKWLRAGATLSPDFMIRNPARDALSAFVYSKYGFIPGLDFMKGVVSILRKDTSYRLYKMSGAEHSMLVSLDREYLQKSFKEVVEGKKFTDYVKHPLALLQIASELGEKATRLGEFKKGLAQGATPLEAGMASREVTLDFAKGGTQAIAVNRIISFFNSNIRGWDRMITAFKEKPVQTSTKIFLGITLPSILLYLVNRDDDRWKEIPQWQKDLFWIVMTKDTIYRIPKPFELGLLFGSGPERLLEWLDNKDPELFKNLWASIWEAGTPGWLPTGLAPIIENITNHSFFRGTPIVSEGKQALPPEFQYTQYSSEVAKGLGNLLKQSPAKIDNLVQGWTGGLGRYAMQGIDKLLRGTGIVPPKIEPSPTAADIPALRAFVVRNPIGSASESVNKFYDVLEEYTAQEKRLKTLLEDGKKSEYETEKAKHPELFVFFDEKTNTVYSATVRFLRQVSSELSDIRKLEDKVYKSTGMTPEKKRELIDGLETIKTQLAQKALALTKNPSNEAGILEVPIKELEDKLGKVLNPVSPISNEKPERYETPDLAKELGQVEGESKLSALLAKNNDILAEVALLPDSALYKIDRSVTRTGLTRRQNELLDQYDAAINKKAFIEEHPEIEVNPKTEWLKSEPESNAILGLWGNAKILTQEAYDIVQDLIKNNDVPDNGLPEGAVPPKEVAKEYFAYNDAVGKFSANSWEAQLIVAKSDKLREFLKRDLIETPIASLELKVKNRKSFDKLDAFSDKESPDYIADDKAREEAIKKFKKDNPAFVDDIRRIEAIEKGGRSASQLIKESRDIHQQMLDDPETLPVPLSEEGKATQRQQIKNYTFILDTLSELVQGKRDEKRISQAIQYLDENIKSDSAILAGRKARPDFPAEVYVEQHLKDLEYVKQVLSGTRIDTVEAWVERGKIVDQFTAGSSEVKVWLVDHPKEWQWALEQKLLVDDGKDWNVPSLRLNAEYREQDKEYNALPTEGTARVDYLAKNEDYRKDRRRREAYGLKSAAGIPFPDTEVENYVDYYEIEGKGFRQERMLVENPTFAQAMHTIKGIDLPDPKKVPAVQYDEIYEANQRNFDRLVGLGDNKSPYYIEDPVKRERMRQLIRMDNGKLTEFGVAEIRRNAYGKFVSEKDIELYVGYYSLIAEGKGEDYAEVNGTDLWYEDDWYLIDNIDFYKEVYVKLLGNERKDFRKVPTREVFQKYVTYIALADKDRDDYRRDNRDLDDWLVIKFGYKPIGEKKPAKPVVPKKKGKLGLEELEEILKAPILTLK